MMLANDLNLRVKPALRERQISITVQLVTEQYGGGATARQPDIDQWLRPSSVRGGLRFWWRALFGSSFPSADKMYAAETAIFGGSAGDKANGQPGKVAVVVKALANAQLTPWAEHQRREEERIKIEKGAGRKYIASARSVAYFPANENKTDSLPSANLVDPSMKATISLFDQSCLGPAKQRLSNEQWQQALESLRAFVLFGGSGARTRRAAGAICISSAQDAAKLNIPVTVDGIEKWLTLCVNHSPAPTLHNCFLLARCQAAFVTRNVHASGKEAQEELLQMWRDFRQQRRHPDAWHGREGWGQSKWPEADAIRLIAGRHASWDNGGHRIEHRPNPSNQGRAPRAHLGLPIIVKYKDDLSARQNEERKGQFRRGQWDDHEPSPTELILRQADDDREPRVLDRYASPILLAVTSVLNPSEPDKVRFIGLVLITSSLLTPRSDVVLKQHSTSTLHPGPWKAVLDSTDAPLGLYQILARRNYQRIFFSEEKTT